MYQNSYGGMMPSQMGAQQYGYGGDGVLGAPPGYSHQATHHQATHHQAPHHQATHHQAPPYPVQAQQLQAQQLQAQQLQAQQLQQQQQYQQQYQQQQMLQQQQVGGSQQMPWGKSSTGATNHEPEPDPEMYETSVYLGIDDDEYDYRTKVIGEKGENLDYVRKSTGSKVLLRGKGSGVYNTRPPHIFISHSTLSGMEDAEKLAYNLVKSVKEDYQEWKSKGGSKAASRAQSGGSQHTGSRESSHVHNYNHGDRGQQQQQQQQQNQAIVKDYGHSSSSSSNRQQSQYDDSSRYSGSYLQDSSSQQRQSYDNGSSQNNNMQQQQQGGRGDGDRYGRSSQPDQRSSMQGGNRAGSSMQGTLYCDICNIHCPNRDMYERHMAGGMHLESVRHNQQKKLAGMRQMDNRGQQRSQPADLGGTHWEGPPEPLNPQQQQWQDLDTGVTLEDYVFTQCEKVLKTMISDIGLRNLKRSVEKIGQRDLKSAIPTQPQTNNYCKLCKETVPNMPQHLTVKSHGNMYLLRQIQLGDLFMDYYSDVPIPGVITNGGRVLAMDTLAFGPYIPETNRERFKELLVYSGAYLAYKCSVCTTNITCLGNWVQHTTSKRHGRAVIENILMYGIEAFIAKNPHIPVPPPRNALEILSSIDNISTLHPTIPRRRSTQIASSGGSEDQTTTGYQQLASLSAQERQLVLQVQALTGIDDLTLVINVLTALGGMDPAMLQTLSALDPLAIQHAVSGNVALQGMDVKFVQKVIKMYMNYKGIPMPTVQQSQQYMTTFRQQQQQSQVVQMSQLRQMYNQQRVNQAQANWVSGVGVLRGNQRSAEKRSGSRWDDGNSGRQDMSRNDRGRKDRDRDRQRGSTDNKGSIKSPAKGKTDNKNRNDKGKPDSKDKKPDNKSDKSKTDKAKTDNKTDKTKTDNKKDVSKETTGKRPGGKVTEPPAKKAAKDSKDAEVLIDLTDEDAVEKKKNDAKNTEEKNEEEKKDAVEKKEEKEETKEEVKEEMETESKEKAEEQKPSTDEEKSENTKTEAKEEAEKEIVEIKDDSDADMKEETKKEVKEEDKQEDLPKPKVEETSEDKETPASSQEDDDIKEVAISEKELIGKSPRGRGRGRRSRGRGRGAAAGTRKTRASIRGKKEEADEVDKSAGEAEKTEDEAEKKEEEPEKKEEEPEKAEDLNTSANESFSLENLETVDEYVADEEPETKKECKEGDIEKTDVKKDEEKETVDTTEKAAEEEAAEEGVDVDMDEGAEGDADCTEEIDEDKLLGDDDEEMQEEAKE